MEINTENVDWKDRSTQERTQIHINEVSKDIQGFAQGIKAIAEESHKLSDYAQLHLSIILDNYKQRLVN